jgi:hypothetical protein
MVLRGLTVLRLLEKIRHLWRHATTLPVTIRPAFVQKLSKLLSTQMKGAVPLTVRTFIPPAPLT